MIVTPIVTDDLHRKNNSLHKLWPFPWLLPQ